MKLRLIIVLLVLGASVSLAVAQPAPAEARTKKWYWTERKAERRVIGHFSDVRTANCIGFGYNWRIRPDGTDIFTAFYCSGRLTDRSHYAITIYTTGRNSFKWFRY